jgi:signal transduction histidine kinase
VADDAVRAGTGDNDPVNEAPDDPLEQAGILLLRGTAAIRRILVGPDGPLALALVLALAAMAEITITMDEVGSAAVANLFATLPLALIRRRVAWAAGLTALGVLVAISDDAGGLAVSGLLGMLIAFGLFAARYGRRWSVLLALPFLVNAAAPFGGTEPGFPGVLLLALVVAALALGDSRRQHGEAVAERDETRRAMADSLRGQAVMEERARIARELHDIVAHHVSAIAVQAEAARLTTAGMPDEGRARLEAIGDTARNALGEMRRLLGVLRHDGNGSPEREPQPGLERLSELLDTARAAGTVRLTLSGETTPLPPGVDLCAFRILQEALTNARRHAPGATVDVEIAYDVPTLRLRVRDDGPGPGDGQPDGHGLLGMRERAIMVGGTLSTGPAEGGGFVVEAELPIQVATR